MSNRVLFFATKKDMILLLNNFTNLINTSIMYVKIGNLINNTVPIFTSINDIPDLGLLPSPNHCVENYLVIDANEKIMKKETMLENGKKVFAIYPSGHSNSIVFSPSGFNKDNTCLIHGQFSTIDDSIISKKLFGLIKKSMRKLFTNEHGWYVGAEAKSFYGKVRFVTISANEPTEYDFKIDTAF